MPTLDSTGTVAQPSSYIRVLITHPRGVGEPAPCGRQSLQSAFILACVSL